MKKYIILMLFFVFVFPSLASNIDNKGLECIYNIDNIRPNEYYWFSDEQVYKVWFDKKESVIKKSTYPAYYKLTEKHIRFYRIFVLLDSLEFTDKNNNILGVCKLIENYKNLEDIIAVNLN